MNPSSGDPVDSGLFQRRRSATVNSTGLDYSTCHRVDEETLSRITFLRLPQNISLSRTTSEPLQHHSLSFDFSTAKSIASTVLFRTDSPVDGSVYVLPVGQISNTDVQVSRRSTESSIPMPQGIAASRSSPSSTVSPTVDIEASEDKTWNGDKQYLKADEARDEDYRKAVGQSTVEYLAKVDLDTRNSPSQTPLVLTGINSLEPSQLSYLESQSLSETQEASKRNNCIAPPYPGISSSDTFPHAVKCQEMTAKEPQLDLFSIAVFTNFSLWPFGNNEQPPITSTQATKLKKSIPKLYLSTQPPTFPDTIEGQSIPAQANTTLRTWGQHSLPLSGLQPQQENPKSDSQAGDFDHANPQELWLIEGPQSSSTTLSSPERYHVSTSPSITTGATLAAMPAPPPSTLSSTRSSTNQPKPTESMSNEKQLVKGQQRDKISGQVTSEQGHRYPIFRLRNKSADIKASSDQPEERVGEGSWDGHRSVDLFPNQRPAARDWNWKDPPGYLYKSVSRMKRAIEFPSSKYSKRSATHQTFNHTAKETSPECVETGVYKFAREVPMLARPKRRRRPTSLRGRVGASLSDANQRLQRILFFRKLPPRTSGFKTKTSTPMPKLNGERLICETNLNSELKQHPVISRNQISGHGSLSSHRLDGPSNPVNDGGRVSKSYDMSPRGWALDSSSRVSRKLPHPRKRSPERRIYSVSHDISSMHVYGSTTHPRSRTNHNPSKDISLLDGPSGALDADIYAEKTHQQASHRGSTAIGDNILVDSKLQPQRDNKNKIPDRVGSRGTTNLLERRRLSIDRGETRFPSHHTSNHVEPYLTSEPRTIPRHITKNADAKDSKDPEALGAIFNLKYAQGGDDGHASRSRATSYSSAHALRQFDERSSGSIYKSLESHPTSSNSELQEVYEDANEFYVGAPLQSSAEIVGTGISS